MKYTADPMKNNFKQLLIRVQDHTNKLGRLEQAARGAPAARTAVGCHCFPATGANLGKAGEGRTSLLPPASAASSLESLKGS